ncbi:hypothetical protein FALBO_6295 [Fusarium albosuccineum]|uniref:Mg2+ transporter protein, CorA-like/Zinc transport protein ZntB n=1 Tax=Fusarium albosuccineum TaxID=1237068 RepID=A0A8H4PBX4_9HYPO|nr:hypothetical protein FALBO_6295 [Fusarium albosuccineum]
MDDYMFHHYVNECLTVEEETSYVQIFNYSAAFAPPDNLRYGTKLLSGVRLIVQKNAKHNDTFLPSVISLPRDRYELMVREMRLPYRGIETTSVVGPFFWCAYDQDDDDPHLQIIHRKSDVLKRGKTRGWEMLLSHSFKTGITTGFIKGTPSSEIEKTLVHLKACAAQVGHPMLLSTIILSYDLSPENDAKQRKARHWLRRLENAVSLRNEVEEQEQYFQDGLIDVDGLNRDLVECHGNVMWKRPQAYMALAKEMEKAMENFRYIWMSTASEEPTEAERKHRKEIDKLHRSMAARLDFYKVKLTGLENYIHITLERLKVQREALYNIMSQREARLNLEIAGEQRRIAHASKRDSTAMKTLSLMGALFLPGTYLASVFSMTFFDFGKDADPVVSLQLWVYFAITVPVTAIILACWIFLDKRRQEQHKKDDADLEKNIDKMEKEIMFALRKRTMSKANTWNTVSPPPKS